jgi:DNA-binding NarL/FixJ family response regulator
MNVLQGCGSCPTARRVRWQPAEGDLFAGLDRVYRLSPRELDVFLLLRDGPSNRELSAALTISERTAKAHIASIIDKLAVRSRLQICLLAHLHHAKYCPEGQ